MKRIIIFTIVALCSYVATVGAEEIAWGKPDNNLCVGLVLSPEEAAFHQPLFDVLVKNVGTRQLTLPEAGAYRARQDGQGNEILAQPLAPELPGSTHKEVSRRSTTSALEIPPPRGGVFMLKPGEIKRFEKVPLAHKSLSNNDNHRVAYWKLLPGTNNTVVFHFENREAQYGKLELWKGRATSGELKVKTKAATLQGFEVQAGFTLPKQEYHVGELIQADFKVFNSGKNAVVFPAGGDYRGSGRHDRFKIEVTNEAGNLLRDPVWQGGAGGGLGGAITVVPGLPYIERVPVNLWCALTQPGRYTLTCKRTLNLAQIGEWENGAEALLPQLEVTSRLTVTLVPDDARKEKMIAALPAKFRSRNSDEVEAARAQLYALALAGDADALPAIREVALGGTGYAPEFVWRLRYYENNKTAAIPVLMELAKATGSGADTALGTLTQWQAPEAGAIARELLQTGTVEQRRAAVQACYSGKFADCLEPLLALANDPDAIVRRNLGGTLGVYGDQRAVPVLLRLLQDPDPDFFIRIWAAEGLGKLGRKDGIPVLIDLLGVNTKEIYPRHVMEALSELTGEKIDPESPKLWLMWWERTGKAKFAKS